MSQSKRLRIEKDYETRPVPTKTQAKKVRRLRGQFVAMVMASQEGNRQAAKKQAEAARREAESARRERITKAAKKRAEDAAKSAA